MLYNHAPDFEAEVRFLTPEEGGRSGRYGPVKQGYRCDVHFDDDPSDSYWMIWPAFLDEVGQELPKDAEIAPFSRANFYVGYAELKRTVHQAWVHEGARFHLCEGARKVAACRVTKVLELGSGEGIKLLNNMFLVQKSPTETLEHVKDFLNGLVHEVYRKRPEWLQYELRETYEFRNQQFVRMFCAAGSVHALLSYRASTKGGITRDILQLGTRGGRPYAWLLHDGKESEHNPDDVKRIS